jgi:hypothetical protein
VGRLGVEGGQRFAMRHSGCRWWYLQAEGDGAGAGAVGVARVERGKTGRKEDGEEGSQKRRI